MWANRWSETTTPNKLSKTIMTIFDDKNTYNNLYYYLKSLKLFKHKLMCYMYLNNPWIHTIPSITIYSYDNNAAIICLFYDV